MSTFLKKEDSDYLLQETGYKLILRDPITCKFYMRDNQLTAISGADAGDYPVHDNYADILIDGVASHVSPFDRTISKIDTEQVITIEVE